jgi:dolichol-phosphate mannosyltransferase
VALVGFRQSEVIYKRDFRLSGAGNYNRYLGSLKIGLNGIIGFSTKPLQIMMWTGFGIALLSVIGIVAVVILKIVQGDAFPIGVPTITVLVLFMGGVQLAAVGVLGEYIGRTYEEVRRRPPYIVDRAINATVLDPRGPRSGPGLSAVPGRSSDGR